VRPGAVRDELYGVCLEQALGRDAAFVAIATADIEGLSDAEYRDAQLAAGWRRPAAPGRLRPRRRRAGMTFYDSQVPALLGEPWTACCSPVSASPVPERPGRPARHSHRVRRVTPAA